jgi:hypothetical protein
LPSASELAAVKVTICGVFCTENDEGAAVSPAGSAETVTATAALKPFCGLIDTSTVDEVPGATSGSDGVTSRVNDGGGGGWLEELLDPPPQAARVIKSHKVMAVEALLDIHRSDLPSLLSFMVEIGNDLLGSIRTLFLSKLDFASVVVRRGPS